jgi:hypothetical protein
LENSKLFSISKQSLGAQTHTRKKYNIKSLAVSKQDELFNTLVKLSLEDVGQGRISNRKFFGKWVWAIHLMRRTCRQSCQMNLLDVHQSGELVLANESFLPRCSGLSV